MKRTALLAVLSMALTSGLAEACLAQAGQASKSSSPEPSLVSFSAGALVVKKPAEYDDKLVCIQHARRKSAYRMGHSQGRNRQPGHGDRAA